MPRPGPDLAPGRGAVAEPALRPRIATAKDWELEPTPKYTSGGVVRMVHPAQTIERTLPLLDTIGVTRVADVTRLDRVGIANYTSVRPRERGEGISYYNGKGLTRTAARAGAIMEAVERYSGEFCDLPVHYATREEMSRRGDTVDPRELYAPIVDRYEPGLRIEWVEGFDLLSQRPTYVPLNAVMCPYEPPRGRPLLFYSSTNGLAAGNTYEEAICSALCEVIERDAEATAAAKRSLAPAVARVLRDIGVEPPRPTAPASDDRFPLIDLDTLPPRPRTLARKLQRAGLRVYLRDVTSTGGIPTLACVIVERRLEGYIAHGGAGTHPDARVAAARALSEAPQSRLGHIQGGREDLPHIVAPPSELDPDALFGGGKSRPFWSIRSYEHETVDDDVRFMLDRLAESGLSQIVAIDLTRPEVGVPVVRIIVPGAETWEIFLQHGCPAPLGRRAGRALETAVPTAVSHA
jgi:ribosomal protein S12 methylthiotransferase accessory factor